MAFEYRWDSSSGFKSEDAMSNPDLSHCLLYEYTTYADNKGRYADGYFYPPAPPFIGWKFREPTDGRSAPVALGCFSATQGWAWDRHKTGGSLRLPPEKSPRIFTISAIQQYRFQCRLCGLDALVPGPDSGPHLLTRTFAPHSSLSISTLSAPTIQPDKRDDSNPIWRYTFHKHQASAYIDMDSGGYVDDSKHVGFGPWET